MNRKRYAGVVALIAGLVALNQLARRWGASEEEVRRSLAGDELIPEANIQTTHAVTVQAPPAAIWPWLVQAGYHRGGWYGNDTTERLFMKYFWQALASPEERPEFRPSATRILPEFQNLKVGDIVPDGPPGTAYFVVRVMEPERHLVLYSTSHLPRMTPALLRDTQFAVYGEFTWVFVLDEVAPGKTRLILRTRSRHGPPLASVLTWPFLRVAEILFPYQILHGIRHRAERMAVAGKQIHPANDSWRLPLTDSQIE